MNTLDYIINKYNIKEKDKMTFPIEIPNIGRNDLAKLFAELGFTVGAEIGTEQGEYAKVLCKANRKMKLYCVDPWIVYDDYTDYRKEIMVRNYQRTKEILPSFNCVIIEKYSMDAVKDFADNSLDFVYIDANHNFQNVTNDIHEWLKKIKVGGIISGHDYFTKKCPIVNGRRTNRSHHVKEVIDGYTRAYDIRPWFVLGRKDPNPGEIRDRWRSWFWVKE